MSNLFGPQLPKEKSLYGNLILLTKGVTVLEIAVGAVFAQLLLSKNCIRDLVTDGNPC